MTIYDETNHKYLNRSRKVAKIIFLNDKSLIGNIIFAILIASIIWTIDIPNRFEPTGQTLSVESLAINWQQIKESIYPDKEKHNISKTDIVIISINEIDFRKTNPKSIPTFEPGSELKIKLHAQEIPVGGRLQFNYKISDSDNWSEPVFRPLEENTVYTWKVPEQGLDGENLTLHFGVDSPDTLESKKFLTRTAVYVRICENGVCDDR